MRKLLLIALVCTLSGYLSAQKITTLDYHLAKLVQEADASKVVPVLVKGDKETIIELTREARGSIKYFAGDIASIKLPVSEIAEFSQHRNIIRMESRPSYYVPTNDTSRVKSKIKEVHEGVAPLSQAYTGKDVVIGIIDTGCDFHHPDFKDANGKTRIKYYWDHHDSSKTLLQPYDLGYEWTAADIDSGICTTDDLIHFGHGTHVSGIAAGNGNGILLNTDLMDSLLDANLITADFNGYMGVAPESDLIIVAYDFTTPSQLVDGGNSTGLSPADGLLFKENVPNRIADAVHYIFTRADAMGKPCVINASLAEYYGSHDGKDLETQLIDNLLTEKPGRALVAAAGNAGGIPYHLGYDVTSDTSFTWVTKTVDGKIELETWGDVGTFENINFSIGVDKIISSTDFSMAGNMSFLKFADVSGAIKTDTIFNSNGDQLAIVSSYGEFNGHTNSIKFTILPDSVNDYYYRLATTGSGKFDSWNMNYHATTLPLDSTQYKNYRYMTPDADKTIGSGFQCSDQVITVGNYAGKNSHIDFQGNLNTKASITPDDLEPLSSEGPTRDGRIKPDIAAPGGYTLSCAVVSNMELHQKNYPDQMGLGGMHERGGGTSASTPVVAGVAALFFEMMPTATNIQLRDAIRNCAIEDAYTGSNLPNPSWGYGKVNAYGALTSCAPASVASINKNENNGLNIYPNPLREEAKIYYVIKDTEWKRASIDIIDLNGKLVKSFSLNATQGFETISTNDLAKGIYMCSLMVNGENRQTEKLVVQ